MSTARRRRSTGRRRAASAGAARHSASSAASAAVVDRCSRCCSRSSGRCSPRTTPTPRNLGNAFVGPVAGHPLGFDGQGRDLLSRLLVGRAHVAARAARASSLLVDRRRDRRWPSSARGAAAGSTPRSRPCSTSCSRSRRSCSPSWPRRVRRGPDRGDRWRWRSPTRRTSPASCAARRCASERSPTSRRCEVPGRLERVAICAAAPGAERPAADRRPGARILFGYAMVDLAAISYLGLGVQPPTGRLGRDGRERPVRRAAGLPGRVAVRRPLHRGRGGRRQPARRAPRPTKDRRHDEMSDLHYLSRDRGARALPRRASCRRSSCSTR